MSEEIKVSLINLSDGKIRWVDKREMKQLLAQENWRIFPNPQKNYYPEHDGNLNKMLGQQPKPILVDEKGEEVLEIIAL